jgi:hypothetical protein
METVVSAPDWTSEDIQNLRTFFQTHTGSRLLPKLVESIPGLLEEGDTNKVLIRNGKVAGGQDMIRALVALAGPEPLPPPDTTPNHYPDLTNDKEWNDGQKIQTQHE